MDLAVINPRTIESAVQHLSETERGRHVLILLYAIYKPGGALNFDTAHVAAWRTLVLAAPGDYNDTVPSTIKRILNLK